MIAELPSRKALTQWPVTCLMTSVAIGLHGLSRGRLAGFETWLLEPSYLRDSALLSQHAWTLITPALLHLGLVHLLLNLLWIWMLGSYIERLWGSGWLLLLWGVSALAGNLAEAAFGAIGVGLSGAVYGYMGWWMVITRRDPRLAILREPQLERVFIVWLFLGSAITWLGLMNIGNLAHLAGMVAGSALALLVPPGALRPVPVPVTMPLPTPTEADGPEPDAPNLP